MIAHLNHSMQMLGTFETCSRYNDCWWVFFVKVKYYHQVFTYVLYKDNDTGFFTLLWQYLYDQQQTLLHRKGSNSNYSRILPPENLMQRKV
jgi:hypothetical protein